MDRIDFLLEETELRGLKRHFALRFPAMRASHRTELAARGLGYRTYASLLAALREGPLVIESIDPEGAIEFARRIKCEVDPNDVSRALVELFDFSRLLKKSALDPV